MDVKVVFLLMLSNILNMLEVLRVMLLIPTLLKMDNVFSEKIEQLDMLNSDHSTLPKMIKFN